MKYPHKVNMRIHERGWILVVETGHCERKGLELVFGE